MTNEEFKAAMEKIHRITAKYMARQLAIMYYRDCPLEAWMSLKMSYIDTAMKFESREDAVHDVMGITDYVQERTNHEKRKYAERGKRIIESVIA